MGEGYRFDREGRGPTSSAAVCGGVGAESEGQEVQSGETACGARLSEGSHLRNSRPYGSATLGRFLFRRSGPL